MNKWKATLVVGLTAALMSLATPAQAQQISITDPAGDTTAHGLDITGARIHNKDHAVVTNVTFARDVRGDFIEAIRARHGHLLRLVIEHRRTGPDTILLLSRNTEVQCAHMASTWDRSAARVHLRLPAKCIYGGNYGALHMWLLSEKRGDGSDVDSAPTKSNGAIGFTPWIPRG
jgi:hypothetical protein